MGMGPAALSSWVVPWAPHQRRGDGVPVSGCLPAPPLLLSPAEAVLHPLLLDRAPAFLHWGIEAALVTAEPSPFGPFIISDVLEQAVTAPA